jgi:hypothetical protein
MAEICLFDKYFSLIPKFNFPVLLQATFDVDDSKPHKFIGIMKADERCCR